MALFCKNCETIPHRDLGNFLVIGRIIIPPCLFPHVSRFVLYPVSLERVPLLLPPILC